MVAHTASDFDPHAEIVATVRAVYERAIEQRLPAPFGRRESVFVATVRVEGLPEWTTLLAAEAADADEAVSAYLEHLELPDCLHSKFRTFVQCKGAAMAKNDQPVILPADYFGPSPSYMDRPEQEPALDRLCRNAAELNFAPVVDPASGVMRDSLPWSTGAGVRW